MATVHQVIGGPWLVVYDYICQFVTYRGQNLVCSFAKLLTVGLQAHYPTVTVDLTYQ